jgi:hypothetical protein
MKLVKRNFKVSQTTLEDFSRAKVTECLQALGMASPSTCKMRRHDPKKYRRINRFEGFWGQDRYVLEDILREAEEAFDEHIKRVHPDKNPKLAGQQARRVISAWRQLRKLFARHGIKKGN